MPKLEQLLDELEFGRAKIRSFRISNTQDISNLTSNRPLLLLKHVFHVLALKAQQQQQQNQRRELFIKMSLQTESFQDMLCSALSSGAFSRLVVKGDYWTVAMEPKTMECIAKWGYKLEILQLVGMSMGTEATDILAQSLIQKDANE